ncbi:MAG: tetratricopeptide repeat protein [Dehalococcoidia bacterium]|nr:tetratricopeptide repeat protein [Dehalococcoidia bacterium]
MVTAARQETSVIPLLLVPQFGQGNPEAEGLFKRGLAAHRGGQYTEAEAAYREVLTRHPDSPATNHNLAVLLAQTARVVEAEGLYRTALKQWPNQPEIYSNLGVLLAEIERYTEALVAYQKAAALGYAPASYNLGNLLVRFGRERDAESAYRAALELDPKLFQAHLNLGVVLEQRTEHLEAETEYRKALENRPDYPVALHNLSRLLVSVGRFEEAKKPLRRLVALCPDDPEAHSLLGVVLAATGAAVDALREFEAAYEHRLQRSDRGESLYRAWAALLLQEGIEAISSRGVTETEKWINAFVDLQRRAKKDRMLKVVKEATQAVKANATKEFQSALNAFLLGVRLAAIQDLWEGWDALAKEVSKRWPKGRSAVDVIREMRD